MIKFSIITVCLNAGQDLIDTVENTLNQSYDNFEIIVKDGFSKDGSIEKLPYNDKIKLIKKKDTGIYDAMNQGIEAATGDYLIFMNCGDWFYDGSVLERIDAAIKEKQEMCYYGLCYNRKLDSINAYPKKVTRFTCFRTMICHQSTVYCRKLFEEKNYDTSYKILADREYLMWIVCSKRISPCYLDFLIVNYQADGACENEKYREQNKKDIQRMNEIYLSNFEQTKFKILHCLTLPRLRSLISSSPKLGKIYMKSVDMIYRAMSKNSR